jgi:hypothetical protein
MSGPDSCVVAEKERTNRFSIQKMAQKCDIVVSSTTTTRIDNCTINSQASVKVTLSHAAMHMGWTCCPVLPEFEKPVWSEVRL